MRVLLDTQAFLWLVDNNSALSNKAKKTFLNQENDLCLSLASIWEMAIKISLKKLTVREPFAKWMIHQLNENSIEQLTIQFRHVTKVRTLAFHHRDPFDRLLIAQALEEDIPILSNDAVFDQYKVKRLW